MLDDANLYDNAGGNGGSNTIGSSIVVAGTRFATSLFWQPLQNPSDFMSEVEEASSDIIEGADLFAVKSGKAPQFGICVSQEGYKAGTNVAAIALMTALSNASSIVGVFEVDGGWWYVCSRNDVILSDGDNLYLDEEEAKNQLLSMLTVPDWDKIYAPSSWNLENTEVGDLEEIFSRGKRIKLQKIKGLRGTNLILVIVASVIVGGWILSSLFDHIMAPPQRKIVAPVRPKMPVKIEAAVIPKPWESLIDPIKFMTECQNTIMKMTAITPPGWVSSGRFLCTDNAVATSWKRDTGLIAWAEETMRDLQIADLQYEFDERALNLSAVTYLGKIVKTKMVPNKKLNDLRFELNKLFQEMGINVNLQTKIVKVAAPKAAAEGILGRPKAAPPVEVSVLGFSLKSEHNPTTWLQFLTKFSSFEINKVEYDINNGLWSYEGVFYVL